MSEQQMLTSAGYETKRKVVRHERFLSEMARDWVCSAEMVEGIGRGFDRLFARVVRLHTAASGSRVQTRAGVSPE